MYFSDVKELDTGIDTGTQLSLVNLLKVNTGLDGTQLSSVDIGPSALTLNTGIDTGTQLSLGNTGHGGTQLSYFLMTIFKEVVGPVPEFWLEVWKVCNNYPNIRLLN